jgi:hypothetical protein
MARRLQSAVTHTGVAAEVLRPCICVHAIIVDVVHASQNPEDSRINLAVHVRLADDVLSIVAVADQARTL